MGITNSVTAKGFFPSGEAYVRGTATFDTLYATGGETLDLSAYISSATYPTVLTIDDDGYVAKHDRGTASAGKIMLYKAGSANAVLSQTAANTNAVAVVIGYLAIGQAA